MVRDYDLSPSLEDYLEVIWDLEEINTVARVKDISERLEVKRSSVTIALRTLGEKGLVNYAPYSVITLTDEGKRVGGDIRKKHNLLRTFFTDILGVDIVAANSAACVMEHGLTPSIQRRLQTFLDVVSCDGEYKADLISKMDQYEQCNTPKEESTPLPLLTGLNELTPGEEGVIHQILGSKPVKDRLHDMGIITGQAIRITANNEDSGVEVQLKNYRLSLKQQEANQILVEKR